MDRLEWNVGALVDMVMAQGVDHGGALQRAGIVTGEAGTATWSLDTKTLRHYFGNLCVVMEGAFLKQYWPRFHRASAEGAGVMMCTCVPMALHAATGLYPREL